MKSAIKRLFSESADNKNEQKKQEVVEQVDLMETTARDDGSIPVKIINAGWGSSGYYSEDVLRRFAGKYKEGTQMYWDHPTESEDYERPERSLRDLAGVLVTDGYYREDGSAGAGIYADAKLFGEYKEMVHEIGRYIGLSHRAQGMSKYGEAEGREGLIVETIDDVISVDFVTLAGRGGEVIQFMESKRQKQKESANDMEWKDITLETLYANRKDLYESVQSKGKSDLKESLDKKNTLIDNLSKSNKELKEAAAANEVEKMATAITKEKDLPEAVTNRITESLKGAIPFKENGDLDKDKAKTSLQEAADKELEYIKALGSGSTTSLNMSESASQSGQEIDSTNLVESFMSMGLSKEEAETAAEGR